MKRNCLLYVSVVLFISSFCLNVVRAEVTLPRVFSSHMVLQRDVPLPIWGWAGAEETVTVQLDKDQPVTAKSETNGNWKVLLPAVKADGKPHTMTVTGGNTIELTDILIGDVWLGSGQSNMEMPVRAADGADNAIPAATRPEIRLLLLKRSRGPDPARDIVTSGGSQSPTNPAWKVCSPASVVKISAVLYYFGTRLQKDLNVPVGLVSTSWGGTPIEDWTPGRDKNGEIYNCMIHPVKPFPVRGVVWYQGESNISDGFSYAEKMRLMIEGWRKNWGYDFPFYYVQIAPFSGYATNALPPLWEAQVASLKIPGTGMAVTTDLVNDFNDIHPRNKTDVGNRLALWALARVYGKDIVFSGPIYKSLSVEGNKIRLAFAHTGAGLKSRDGKPLNEFEIAGEDGKFFPAEAAIDGKTVVVKSKDVQAPVKVRFGWHNVANPNLANNEGLPASPFHTDNWQGGTGE